MPTSAVLVRMKPRGVVVSSVVMIAGPLIVVGIGLIGAMRLSRGGWVVLWTASAFTVMCGLISGLTQFRHRCAVVRVRGGRLEVLAPFPRIIASRFAELPTVELVSDGPFVAKVEHDARITIVTVSCGSRSVRAQMSTKVLDWDFGLLRSVEGGVGRVR